MGRTRPLPNVSRGVAAIEALALRRRGARVTTINRDEGCAAMGTNLMGPGRRERVIAAGVKQGRQLGARPYWTGPAG